VRASTESAAVKDTDRHARQRELLSSHVMGYDAAQQALNAIVVPG
jgi:hypothetical protein